MKNPQSIIPLVSSWEQYIAAEPGGNIQDFARWLLAEKPSPPSDSITLARHSLATDRHLDAMAASALLITRLQRIMHHRSKPAIKELGFTKDMEFAVLVQVALMGRPNKKELCRQLLIENSTGVEITRRLAKKGYLLETVDENDRRSARLSITEKGEKVIKKGYESTRAIHLGFLDCLLPEQQQQLVGLLAQLHDYHSERLQKSYR